MRATEANLAIFRGKCKNLPRPSFCHGVEWIADVYGPCEGVEFPMKVDYTKHWCRECKVASNRWQDAVRQVKHDCMDLPDNGEIAEEYWYTGLNDAGIKTGSRVWRSLDGWRYTVWGMDFDKPFKYRPSRKIVGGRIVHNL